MMEVKSKDKMTEVGEIPVEWEVQSLSSVLDIRDGTHDSPNYVQRGVPFLTSKNLGKGKLKFKEVNYITEEDHKKFSERSLVENGDILFGMIGTVGNPVIVDLPYSISIKNVALVKFHKSNMNNKYVLEYLNSQNTLKQFKKESNGGVQKFIALGKIREIKITVPPLKEQKKIAEILSTVDEQIEQTDQLIEKTKELKKGLMQQLLIKGVGHTEFKQSAIGEIPVDWEVKPLEEIADVKGGKRLPKGKSLVEDNTGFPYIRVSDMESGGVSLNNIQYVTREVAPKISSYRIYKGELFISVAGTLGIVGDIPIQLDGANLTENANRICNITINHSYLKYLLTSSLIQNEIDKVKTTSAQPKLALTRIKKFLITVPPLKEQQKIADILSSVDEDIEGYEEEKVKYEELKKGLMQQLLTGKTRVKVD